MAKPSPATENRTLRAELRREREERQRWQREIGILRGQLTKAQQETAEWKGRFDALLARVPMKPMEPSA